MEWKNDAELFELLRGQLYTAIVGDVLDTFDKRRQFLPAQCRPLRPDMVVAGRAMTVHEVDVSQESDQPFGLMFEECLSGCFPNVNLRTFPNCARQASISDIAARLHAAFPG
jgi:hypothetical protein